MKRTVLLPYFMLFSLPMASSSYHTSYHIKGRRGDRHTSAAISTAHVDTALYLVVGAAGRVVVVERAGLRRVPVARGVVHRHCEGDLHASRDVVEEADSVIGR